MTNSFRIEMWKAWKLDLEVSQKFEASLNLHIRYVRQAGKKIGVDKSQLDCHDDSKWSKEEFPAYARYFHSEDKRPDDFAKAWLHHIHYNPHHWQHWIFPDRYTSKGSSVENGVIEMPENYALEMIADWMGASKAYTGSWDMTEWLSFNFGKIIVHSKTHEYLILKLEELGYSYPFSK